MGKRIALTRPREQAGDFEQIVAQHGGIPILAPAIAIREPDSYSELDAALHSVKDFDLIIFTSVNAVTAVCRRAKQLSISLRNSYRGRIAVVGRATAEQAAAEIHDPEIVSNEGTVEALVAEVGSITGQRILFPRGNLANPATLARLSARGAMVTSPVVYNTEADTQVAALAARWKCGSIDAVLFASPSAVRSFASALKSLTGVTHHGNRPALFCIGKMTASAARDAELPVTGIAARSTQNDLINCVAEWFAHRETAND